MATVAAAVAACRTSPTPNSCAFVALKHLARPLDVAGKTLICDPRRVSPGYREQYFPGYVWGDDTWKAARGVP